MIYGGGQRSLVDQRFVLPAAEIAPQHPIESAFELSIGQSVAERINRRVRVAQEVGEIEQVLINAALGSGAEAGDQRQYVIRRPTNNKGTQYEADRAQRLAGSVFRLRLVPLAEAARPAHHRTCPA